MNIDLASRKFTVRDTTREIIIPGNPVGQLMYYLNCVSSVIATNILNVYTNYSQYFYFPESKIPDLIALAKLLNPGIMIKSRLFFIEDYVELGNRFLEITNETVGIHANEEVAIGGIIVRVRKIMVCTNDWLLKNYFLALQKTQNYLNRRLFPPLPVGGGNYNYNRYSDNEEICCCNIF